MVLRLSDTHESQADVAHASRAESGLPCDDVCRMLPACACECVCLCVRACVCMSCMHVYVYMYVHMCARVHVCAHACMYAPESEPLLYQGKCHTVTTVQNVLEGLRVCVTRDLRTPRGGDR